MYIYYKGIFDHVLGLLRPLKINFYKEKNDKNDKTILK